jgi:hypothetical protein
MLAAARTYCALAALLFSVAVFGFFRNLESTLSDYSWGDVMYHVQVFHNLVKGKPLQMSLYHHPGHGVKANPAPFANQAAVHSNFTPFLFAPLFALRPDMEGLYALVVALNLISALLFGLLILRELRPKDAEARAWLFAGTVLLSSLFRVAHYKNHFLLFGAPFFFAAHWLQLKGRFVPFLGAMLLLCLVGEDATLFALSYAAYLLVLEPGRRRYGAWALACGAAVLLIDVSLLMPAARFEMVRDNDSHLLYKLRHPGDFLASIKLFPRSIRLVALFLPALAAAAAACRWETRFSPARLAGLILLAPGSYWLVTLLSGGDNHLMPILWCLVVALVTVLAHDWRVGPDARKARGLAALCALVFIGGGLVNLGRDFPRALDAAQRAQRESNRAVIAEIRSLPEEATVVLWTNETVLGFVANRRKLWFFPDFYDRADYFVAQKDALRSWYGLGDPATARPGVETFDLGFGTAIRGDAVPIGPGLAEGLKKRLGETHEVARESAQVLVLRRKTRLEFPETPSSIGFGYLRHLPAVLLRR